MAAKTDGDNGNAAWYRIATDPIGVTGGSVSGRIVSFLGGTSGVKELEADAAMFVFFDRHLKRR